MARTADTDELDALAEALRTAHIARNRATALGRTWLARALISRIITIRERMQALQTQG